MSQGATTAPSRRRSSSECTSRRCGRPLKWKPVNGTRWQMSTGSLWPTRRERRCGAAAPVCCPRSGTKAGSGSFGKRHIGLAASRCRSGWSGARAATSTPRVRCGRSFVSIGFRGSSKAARPTGAQIPSPSYLFNNGDSADGRSSAPSNIEGQADELKATEPHQLMQVNQVFVVRISHLTTDAMHRLIGDHPYPR